MGGVTLLHPWLLAGLAAAVLPVLIHLIGRRRAPTVRFAAFDFLLAVNKRLARRERLRQILLLILRTLAVAALVAAIARPMPHVAVAAPEGNRRLVLVLDASGSMAYQHGGTTLLQAAKRQARELVSHLQPGDPVTLVIAGAEVRVPFQTPVADHDAVRAAIDAVEHPAGVADLGSAIDAGLAQLGNDGAGALLAVVSDLSENSFAGLRPSTLEPAPEVRLIDAAAPLLRDDEGVTLGNVGIESVRVEASADAATERRFQVVFHNWGSAPVSGRAFELVIDGNVTHRGYLSVPGRGTEEKTLTHTFDAPGIYRGVVRLVEDDGDGYAVDDQAAFVAEVVPGVRVLAVNGDPRTTPYEDELYFLERALQATPRGEPPISVRLVTVDELPDQDLEGFDVITLANVGSLPEAEISRLRSFLKDGRGLFLTMGDRIQFEAVNAAFGPLLPHPLRDLRREADERAGTPPIGIGDLDWDHPILAGLGRAMEPSLRASRTSSYFNLDVGSGLKARPILRFENGAPALVERLGGPGRVILLTTSVDVDFTDLPLRSGFPPLVQRTVRYLADAVSGLGPGQARQGTQVDVALPTGARGMALVSPHKVRREGSPDSGGHRVSFHDLDEVGLYHAEVQRETWTPEPRLDLAVNAALDESDFQPVRAERVSEALGGERRDAHFSVTVGSGEQQDPFALRGWATYLLVALCMLFVGESLLASRG